MTTLHNLTLKRPIIFFDLEATGTNPQVDRIVEISVAKLSPGGESEVKTRLINPGRPIPADTSSIHGIRDEDVANEPGFNSIATSLYLYFKNCDIARYNIIKYDIPLLYAEFKRCGLDFSTEGRCILDAQHIFHKMEPRTLGAAMKFYCGKELEDAHSAEADVLATISVLDAQILRYPNLPKEVESLHGFCNPADPKWIDKSGKFKWDDNNEPIIAFGKNKGIPLKEIAKTNPNFLSWLIRMVFQEDAKKIARDALSGKFPVQ